MSGLLPAFLALATGLLSQSIPFPGPGTVHSSGATIITQVGSGACAASSNTNSATTAAQDTTSATGLDVVISYLASAGTPVVSDSKGNTWTSRSGPYTGVSGNAVRLYHADSPTVGSSHTFTITLASSFPSICSMAFAGVKATGAFDVEHGATAGTGITVQPGSVTPSLDGEVLIAGLSTDIESMSASINSSFTGVIQAGLVSAEAFAVGMAYKIQTTAGAENPTWTTTFPGNSLAANIATYKVGP